MLEINFMFKFFHRRQVKSNQRKPLLHIIFSITAIEMITCITTPILFSVTSIGTNDNIYVTSIGMNDMNHPLLTPNNSITPNKILTFSVTSLGTLQIIPELQ